MNYFIAGLTLAIALLGCSAVFHAGAITGEVKFGGMVSEPQPIQVSKDHDYCGSTLTDDSLLIGPNGGLKNVVLYIEAQKISSLPSGKANTFDTDGCRFVPRVSAMRLGEKLILKNSDPKLHIVHSYLEKQTVFNVAVPFKNYQMELTHKIKKTGLLQINCDTHAWMRGYIHVFDHPFFAVTDEKGLFYVSNVPAGIYTLKAWHEKTRLESIEINVPETGEIKVDLEVGRWQ